jgi:hypothetical protein
MTLAGFLLARLAEDEEVAHVFDWSKPTQFETIGMEPSPEYVTVYVSPARVLAECEAKRRIVEAWAAADRMAGSYPGTDAGIAMGLELAVEFLALPYADHPDYDEAWRP